MNKFKDDEIVLLLTATVTPQYDYMAHKAKERLQHYLDAINYYLNNYPYRLVIGENSGYKELVNHLDANFRNRVELICYKDTDSTRHYGYNEMIILQRCKSQSAFLKTAELIVKITGRNKVLNLNQLLSQIRSPRGDFFAAETGVQLLYINARCFFFTKSLWNDVLALTDGVGRISHDEIKAGKTPPPGVYVDVETAYGALIRARMYKDKKGFRMLKYPILLSGKSGYYGSALDVNLKIKVKKYVKCYLKFLYWQYVGSHKFK